jgi:hypothetical protein
MVRLEMIFSDIDNVFSGFRFQVSVPEVYPSLAAPEATRVQRFWVPVSASKASPRHAGLKGFGTWQRA